MFGNGKESSYYLVYWSRETKTPPPSRRRGCFDRHIPVLGIDPLRRKSRAELNINISYTIVYEMLMFIFLLAFFRFP